MRLTRRGPLVLDGQGVVFNRPLRAFLADVARHDGRSPDDVWELWRRELRAPFWEGSLSRAAMWGRLAPGRDIGELEAELESRYGPGPLDALVRSVEDRPLWLFTNHRALWLRPRLVRFGLAGRFERVLISDEIGAAKPSASAFAHLLELAPADTLTFVDDSLRNVESARRVGIEAWHLDDFLSEAG